MYFRSDKTEERKTFIRRSMSFVLWSIKYINGTERGILEDELHGAQKPSQLVAHCEPTRSWMVMRTLVFRVHQGSSSRQDT